jgi:nucleotide-binding universal stress UspA family protein
MPLSNVKTILLPTDFSDGALVAFVHALKLAILFNAELDLFHVEPDNTQTDWHWGPNVRGTLERWGVLPAGSTDADLEARGIRIRRSTASGIAADQAIFNEMANTHADLVVMATHGRAGLARWLQPSISVPIATKGAVPVLLVPPGERGFVDPKTGHTGLDRILVPVDKTPNPKLAWDNAVAFLKTVGGDHTQIATLHVGGELAEAKQLFVEGRDVEHFTPPTGDPVTVIAAQSAAWNADLVVVATEGRQGFMDGVRGSTVERMIGVVAAPLLIVPVKKA